MYFLRLLFYKVLVIVYFVIFGLGSHQTKNISQNKTKKTLEINQKIKKILKSNKNSQKSLKINQENFNNPSKWCNLAKNILDIFLRH